VGTTSTPEGKEKLSPNMPEPRGLGFVISAKVDADHAADTVARRFVHLNCAPIYWLSKKQTSCESSSFGSEFVAMKQCCEYMRGLRHMRGLGIAHPNRRFFLLDVFFLVFFS
jgi:hypothetical protein